MAEYNVVDAEQLDRDLTAVADAIRQKAGTSEALTFPEGMAEAIAGISGSGGEVDYLSLASKVEFNNLNLFGKREIDITLARAPNIGSMFAQGGEKNTTVEHITLTCLNKPTSTSAVFYASKGEDDTLKHITFQVDTSESTTFSTVFYRLRGLQTIDGTPINATKITAFTTAFNGCVNLRDIRFAEKTVKADVSFGDSVALSRDSICSIVNSLSDTASALTLTLSKRAVNTAFETAAEAADGATSAAWLALIGTRSSWTINLV